MVFLSDNGPSPEDRGVVGSNPLDLEWYAAVFHKCITAKTAHAPNVTVQGEDVMAEPEQAPSELTEVRT